MIIFFLKIYNYAILKIKIRINTAAPHVIIFLKKQLHIHKLRNLISFFSMHQQQLSMKEYIYIVGMSYISSTWLPAKG